MHAHESMTFGSLAIAAIAATTLVVVTRYRAGSRRQIALVGGVLACWVAVGSPLGGYVHELLSAHMLQHLLLSTVAAPLLWLGASEVPARTWTRSLGRVLGHPIVTWSAPVVVLFTWHVPAMFDLALRSPVYHTVEQASFLASGLLFWSPIVGSFGASPGSPRWLLPLYLFLATLPCDALSAFLAFSDRVVYSAYLTTPRHVAVTALQDQACAGALMWVAVTLAYGVPAVAITTTLLEAPAADRGFAAQ